MTGLKLVSGAALFPTIIAMADLQTAWERGGMVAISFMIIGAVWAYALKKDAEVKKAIADAAKAQAISHQEIVMMTRMAVEQQTRANILNERLDYAIRDNTRVLEHCKDKNGIGTNNQG